MRKPNIKQHMLKRVWATFGAVCFCGFCERPRTIEKNAKTCSGRVCSCSACVCALVLQPSSLPNRKIRENQKTNKKYRKVLGPKGQIPKTFRKIVCCWVFSMVCWFPKPPPLAKKQNTHTHTHESRIQEFSSSSCRILSHLWPRRFRN